MTLHSRFADNTNENSVASQLRRKRLQPFLDILARTQKPARILDVGGRQKYWEIVGFLPDATCEITLLNMEDTPITLPHFTSVRGDACDMRQFADGAFDIVFSNSVIEHVGDKTDQQCMANEVQRVGRRYYVQTPNRHFPIEPHFVFPFFQYLPVAWRVWLLQRFNLGWYCKTPNYARALAQVTEIRLLTQREFAILFPNAHIVTERYFGLAKSFVAYLP